jgi:hypothetical protein
LPVAAGGAALAARQEAAADATGGLRRPAQTAMTDGAETEGVERSQVAAAEAGCRQEEFEPAG